MVDLLPSCSRRVLCDLVGVVSEVEREHELGSLRERGEGIEEGRTISGSVDGSGLGQGRKREESANERLGGGNRAATRREVER